MASFWERMGRKGRRLAAPAARMVRKVPGARAALKLVPGLGTVLAAKEIFDVARSGMSGRSFAAGAGMALPGFPGGGGVGDGMIPFDPNMGKRSIFRDDPNVAEALKAWAIPERDLKQFFRAPKGFVVLRDKNGDAFGIPKKIAKAYLGYKDADRPPISVRDWNSLKRADKVIKTFGKIEQRARRIGNFGTRKKSKWETMAQAAGEKAVAKSFGKLAA